ncbi:unnamed protein product, partial [Symbiodinium sp. CCMP2592]
MSGHDPRASENEVFMRNITHARSSLPRQPWEQPAMLCIFDPLKAAFPQGLNLPYQGLVGSSPVPQTTAQPSDSGPSVTSGSHCQAWTRAVKAKRGPRAADRREEAYRRVLTLLHAFSSFFDLCTLMADDEEDGQDSVQAVLAGKSQNTILKHVGPVRTFCEWLLKASYAPPFAEKTLWSFIHCVLKMPKTAATTLDSSLRAIKWSYYTLGLRVQLEVFSSPRIHGVVKKALQTKNPWCPATPLKVSEVLQLHAICCDPSISVIDRCGAAHFLAMLYARARPSDIRCVKSILIDVHNEDWSSGFIELGTLEHKTSRLDTQRRRILPLAGLPNDQADVPFLPAPLPDGSWSSDPLSSSEITRWLRYLLPRPSSEQAVSSHSLKVTSLVWCSKFGMLRETKRVLGHHADAATGSDAVYGRELQSAALREYVVVLDAVATGKFLPDQTRSGHFASGWTRESVLQAAAFPPDSEVLQAAVEDDQDDALAVVSDVSDSDEEAPEEQSFWAHPTSQLLVIIIIIGASLWRGRKRTHNVPSVSPRAQFDFCLLEKRADEISLAKRVVDALKGEGVTTLAQLAFCVGQPGQVLSQTEFDTWSEAMLVGITVGEKASLRPLILEAQTMLVASLKDLAEPAEHASPKKVGVAERNARMDQLRTQLAGVSLTGQLEPSHALLDMIDMAVQQWESRCLKYIGPEKCHSREDEVQNIKPLTTSLSLEGGKLKVTETAGMDDRDIEGSLQVLNALRRRGVAYAFARLISWEKHEAYIASLFRYLTKPAQPGYRKVSLRQILRADKLAFSKLSEAGEDIRADASGTLPLDAAIGAILHDYDLIVALLPMGDLDGKGKNANGRGGRPGPYGDTAPWKGKNGKGKGDWNSKGSDNWTGKGKNTWQAKGKSPKGKGSGAGKPEWLPEGLRFQGASAWNHKGNKVCYGFNLGTCSDANCQKGDHTCCIFKCGGDHPVGGISVADVAAPASPPFGVGVDPASKMVDVDDSPILVEPTVLDAPTMPSASSESFSLEHAGSEGALPSPLVASQDNSPAPQSQEPSRAILQCFAGQARVASALIKQGYFSYGVDRFKQKAAMAPVLQMDLSTREACDSVLTWLDKRKIAGVMICIPKPASEPVTTAFILAVMAGCLSNNLPMILEGSVSSPFWENRLPAAQHPPHQVEVDWRYWDPHSKQRSFVLSNMPEVLTVRRESALLGHKVHQRSEAQTGYPPVFATAVAEVFIAGLTQRQLPCRSPALTNKSLRVSAMNQPRGAMPEVVSEWKLVVYVFLPPQVEDPFGGSKRLKQDWRVPQGARVLPELGALPQDSQLLSRTQSGGQLSPQLQQEMQNLNGASVLRVGIPWDPIEFIAKAGKIGHPYHKLSKCNKDLRDLVHDLVHKPGMVRSQRKNYIEKWARRAKELEPEEAKLKAGMSDHRRKILQPKRILLFEEMLRDIGYDDMGVVQELIDAATLTGDIPITGVLDTKLKPARLDNEQILGMSDEIKQQIRAKTGSSGDKEIDQLLWDKTMEEVQSGYLSGPYDFESLPKRCLVSSRFPLLQGEKLRPIDNYSSSLINDTVTVSEKPITHSIDEIAMLINTLSSAARKKNLNALYGKTADLKGAYRQLAVSDTSLDFSYLSVYDPAEEKPKLFQQLAVPFGSTKAVYFFLRVARALWTILVKGARIPTTNYFDDFVLLALGGDRSSCSHVFDEVMKLLGWKLSADKTTEWNTSFEALGVLFELDQTGSGVLKVRNTEKRRKELTAAIKGFLDKGAMTQKEALQLRGRLQFAQAQFFGRLGRRCLTEVTKHAYTGRSKLSSMAKERLEEFGKFLDMAQPRLVGQVSCRTFMILTDAAFETESGTGGLGGVLLTGAGSALSFFSVPISEQQAKSMSLQDEHTIIYELEMFGVLIGLKLLVEKTAAFAESYEQPGAVAGTGVICYIDNDAARHAYIAGSSKKGVAGILIDEVNFLEYVHGILPWYARVASPANLADDRQFEDIGRVRYLLPHRVKIAPVCKLDLATASGQSVIWDVLQARKPFAVHLAPPILSDHKALAQFICDIIGWCAQNDVVVSLEQPDRSEGWALLTSCARSRLPSEVLSKWAGLQKVVFPICMHGGSSRALTRLFGTPRVFESLAVACDGKHWHGPRPGAWAVPAAYPQILCNRIADCLLQCAKARSATPSPITRLKEASTAALGRQTKRHAPLVPEYRSFKVVPQGSKLQPCERILSAKFAGGSTEDGPEASRKQWKVGILHSPSEFLSKALSCPHPLDAARPLSKHFLDALEAVMTTTPKVLELKRKLAIAKAEILVKKLSCSEKARHQALPGHMKKVLTSKNLSLFEALLKEHEYWDMGVVQLMEKGVDLVGFQDSQLLSRTQSGGQLSPQLQQEMQNLNGASVLRVGIPWDPIEFIAKAGKIGHPYHKLSKCNKDLRDLVHDLVHKPGMVRSQRKNYIEKWARRAKELEPEEAKLKAGMSDHRRKILQPKRILLFEEMLRDIGYDDMGVVQELIDAATLTGDIPITGVLDTKLKPARLDNEQILGMSDEIKQQIRAKTGSSGDKEIDQLLWDKTMEEVQSG